MQALQDIFAIWPDLDQMASAIGQKKDTVYRWMKSGRIPETHWTRIIEAAALRETLVTIADLYRVNRVAKQRGYPAHKNTGAAA